jgi:hypothetical protein
VIAATVEQCAAGMAEEGFHDYTLATRLERYVAASAPEQLSRIQIDSQLSVAAVSMALASRGVLVAGWLHSWSSASGDGF